MKKGGMNQPEPELDMDLSDIEGEEEFEIDDTDISFSSYPDMNMNNETDRESMTIEQSEIEIEPNEQNSDFGFESQGSLHLSDLETPANQMTEPETTNESIMSIGGRYKKRRRLTRKKRNTKRKGKKERKHKTYKKNKAKKTRKTKRRKYRGGNVDKLGSPDFNPNVAFDKKMIGGTNVGATCNDPNYSIYNTRMLSLFPYTPKP